PAQSQVAAAATAAPAPEEFRVPGLGMVPAGAPRGAARQVVLFLSGDSGWTAGVAALAERLRDEGALVVGIDIRVFVRSLETARSCAYPTGNVEEISRFVQQRMKLPAYQRPIVAGYAAGATMAYAIVAAAPNDTLAGAVSLSFCPDIRLRVPFCHMRGLKTARLRGGVGYALTPYADSSIPWMVLQGDQDRVCAPADTARFVAATGAARLFSLPNAARGLAPLAAWEGAYLEAYRTVSRANAAADVPRVATPAVADLSLVEVPAAETSATTADTMAIVLSGDGGWAELDKAVAQGLAARGVPVVGWSSLDYYWTPRTPEQAALALARIVDHYSAVWSRPRVIVVGYSFGADVAPFLVNRLPPASRSHVASLGLLAPSERAEFEFHVLGWIGASRGTSLATRPEMARLTVPTQCVVPEDDTAPSCQAGNPRVRTVSAPAGHHFGGDYDRLVDLLLK
ncbi:MAG: AcvB/VirJ family lysyl-phosphatidylglycerol hydrolase, partial [Acidobacteriota bacterium]